MNTEEPIFEILEDLGLTSPEASLYVFLAKKGPKKGKELLEALKFSRQKLYRSLRNLQNEGLIYGTLERPAQFSAYSFENVCNLVIKRKIDEAETIKKNQKELSSILEVPRKEKATTQGKLVIIQGEKNIYRKAVEMINESKYENLSITSVKDLLSANKFGLYDAITIHPLKSFISCRYLTDITPKDVTPMKKFIEKSRGNSLKGRAMRTNVNSAARFIIQDNEAVFFFISASTEQLTPKDQAVGFWTDSKEFVLSVRNLYEYLWQNSVSVERKLAELETGTFIPDIQILTEPDMSLKKYKEKLTHAKIEILAMLSKQGVEFTLQMAENLKKAIKNGVHIKIIAPLTDRAIKSFRKISPLIELRITDKDYAGIFLIDREYMFLSKGKSLEDSARQDYFDMLLYTNDLELIEETKNIFDDLWNKSIS